MTLIRGNKVDKPERKKGTAGRNSKYDPDTFPLLAEKYARQGLDDKQIMANLGVSAAVFYPYLQRYPEFAAALKRGRVPVNIEVENALLKRALGYVYDETHKERRGGEMVTVKIVRKSMPPDVGAIAFWLKNRLPDEWREKQYSEVTGKDGKDLVPAPVDISKLSSDEKNTLLKIARKIGPGRGQDDSEPSQTPVVRRK